MVMNPAPQTLAENPAGQGVARGPRSKAPVFVLGSGRSGTKLLYHMLLSSGGFAIYHAESNVFNLLGLRFGDLSKRASRRRLLDHWLKSQLFYRSGLTREEIEPRIMEECHNAGDFLRILMEAIARKQGVERWAECTPNHLLYLPLIKKLIPDALVVHIVRDGRDVTVSLQRIGWIRPLPWDRKRALFAPALFWHWIISKGRKYGKRLGGDYMEVRYEDLVQDPRGTLARIGDFIQHDLDYDRILQNPLGAVQNPNSSFRGDGREMETSALGRWKTVLSPDDTAKMESVIGDLLTDLDYPLVTPAAQRHRSLPLSFMRWFYPKFYDVKLWLRNHTPLARTAGIGIMAIDPPADDAAS
jgi:Sulfotransferase family